MDDRATGVAADIRGRVFVVGWTEGVMANCDQSDSLSRSYMRTSLL